MLVSWCDTSCFSPFFQKVQSRCECASSAMGAETFTHAIRRFALAPPTTFRLVCEQLVHDSCWKRGSILTYNFSRPSNSCYIDSVCPLPWCGLFFPASEALRSSPRHYRRGHARTLFSNVTVCRQRRRRRTKKHPPKCPSSFIWRPPTLMGTGTKPQAEATTAPEHRTRDKRTWSKLSLWVPLFFFFSKKRGLQIMTLVGGWWEQTLE